MSDIGVIQRRQHSRLALEPRHPVGVGRELLGQHLEGHLAAELGVLGAPHLSHPARAERPQNLVRTESLSLFHSPAASLILKMYLNSGYKNSGLKTTPGWLA